MTPRPNALWSTQSPGEKRAYIVHFDSLDTPRAISFRAKLDAGDA